MCERILLETEELKVIKIPEIQMAFGLHSIFNRGSSDLLCPGFGDAAGALVQSEKSNWPVQHRLHVSGGSSHAHPRSHSALHSQRFVHSLHQGCGKSPYMY